MLKFYFAGIIQSSQQIYEKREGSGPDPDPVPYLWLMDPDPGGPENADPGPNTVIKNVKHLRKKIKEIASFQVYKFYLHVL